MAKNILFDTGYWFALYDERDSYHENALLLFVWLAQSSLVKYLHQLTIPNITNLVFNVLYNQDQGIKILCGKR